MSMTPPSSPPRGSSVRAVLEAARAKIARPECWTKGRYSNNDGSGPYCAVGAAIEAHTELNPGGNVWPLVHNALRDAAGETCVELWNDESSRTHVDVLALFDRALSALGGE